MNTFLKISWLFSLLIALGCLPAHAAKPQVIATISIIGDVVKNVAGDKVNLVTLVGPDGDAHEYEPVPQDSVNLSKADLIFENGLHLEHWLDKLYEASGSKAARIVVSEGVIPRVFENNSQETDPHAWQDVNSVILYTQNITKALDAFDPANKAIYDQNAANYIKQLQDLNQWVKKQVATIPQEDRKLVTNHDALGYFARGYGFQIIGAVIPSATTEAADPSAKQTVELINIIEANHVHAVFSENITSPKLAQMLSQEAGVKVAPDLYTDALGAPGTDGDTYIKMIHYNVGVFEKYLK